MKFINCAVSENEQNMSVVQRGSEIFYEATTDIYRGTELLVWYGTSYELYLGLPTRLKGAERETKDKEKESGGGKYSLSNISILDLGLVLFNLFMR